MTRKPPDTKQRLRRKADALLQEITRAEHPNCEVCGNPTRAGHHFFKKSQSSELRYDFKNIVPVCQGCHFKYHNGQPEMIELTISKRGADWYNDLLSRKVTQGRRNAPYYRGVIEMLEARLEGKNNG